MIINKINSKNKIIHISLFLYTLLKALFLSFYGFITKSVCQSAYRLGVFPFHQKSLLNKAQYNKDQTWSEGTSRVITYSPDAQYFFLNFSPFK